jgi:hypothetical protein
MNLIDSIDSPYVQSPFASQDSGPSITFSSAATSQDLVFAAVATRFGHSGVYDAGMTTTAASDAVFQYRRRCRRGPPLPRVRRK